jgi:Raf kinase inhibitor-like YbhB/YbcL family protein
MRLILARDRSLTVFGTMFVFGPIFMLILAATSAGPASTNFNLKSSAFENETLIPKRYSCSGLNRSPALTWTGAPSGTRSFALIVSDPDAPGGTFIHWVVYNIASKVENLPEGASTSSALGDAEQGLNGRGELGYTGPCPPPGKPHHYHFRLYAVDRTVELKPGATAEQLESALKGHVLGVAELVGMFGR